MACEQKISNWISCLVLFLLLTWTSEILGASRAHNSVNSLEVVRNQSLLASKSVVCYCPPRDGSSKFSNFQSPMCNNCKKDLSITTVTSTIATTTSFVGEMKRLRTVNNGLLGGGSQPRLTINSKDKYHPNKHPQRPFCNGCKKETTTNNLTDGEIKPQKTDEENGILRGDRQSKDKFHQSNTPPQPLCSSCIKEATNTNNLTDDQLQKLRIDEIKLQILTKLRMKDRPKVTISRNMVPTPIMHWDVPYKYSDFAEKNLDDYYAKTEQMIIMSEITEHPFCPTSTSDPAGCFSFVLNNDLMDKEINSAELWVFKLRDERDRHNQTYIVTDFVRDNQSVVKRTNTVAIRDTSLKDGWLKFDLTTTVRRWILKPNSSVQMLEVSCKTCAMDKDKVPVSSDPGERPFIVINFNHEDDKKRYRRGLLCEESTVSCCMESLYVNFTDINWNDWILQPEGYYANYCRGSCIEEITMGVYKHTSVIQIFLLKNRNNLSPRRLADLAPCCTSTRTSHLQILYIDASKNVRMELIPNMAVESCGCN
ncbi:hypothetical protein CHUAL_010873 [Chamberlinius hualienensis]